MTLLNKKSKNHFLGMKLLTFNTKAAVYADSDIDSIECMIGVEELAELTNSNYVTPDAIGNLRKAGDRLPHRGNIITPGPITFTEFSRNVFGVIVNFNLVFEYHPDTKVSDILSLFDPNFKNNINFEGIKDPYISNLTSEEELAVAINVQSAFMDKQQVKKFIESNKLERKTFLHGNEDYSSYDFIYFVSFPNIHYLKKYDQYYIYTDCIDYQGKEFAFAKLDTTGSNYKSLDPYFRYGLDAVTDILYFQNNLYIQLKSTSSYADNSDLDFFKQLVKIVNENAAFINYIEEHNVGRRARLKELNFDYKLKIEVKDCPELLIKILNEFRHIYSSGFNPRGPNSTKNISRTTYSINDTVTGFCVSTTKKTINLKSNRGEPLRLDLLRSVNNEIGGKFKDNYTLEVLRLPMFTDMTRASVSDMYSNYVITKSSIDLKDITNSICCFYTNLYSGVYNVDNFSFGVAAGHIHTCNAFNGYNVNSQTSFPYYELPDLFMDLTYTSIFTSKRIKEALLPIYSKVKYVESANGEQAAVLYAKNGIPAIFRRIQYDNLTHIINKSTKGTDLIHRILNPGPDSPSIVNYKTILKNDNITNNITVNDKYYHESSNITQSLNKKDISFGERSELFEQAFKSVFYGNGVVPSIVDILKITEFELENPSRDLVGLFIGVCNMVSMALKQIILHPSFSKGRNYYGISPDYINLSNNIETILLETKVPYKPHLTIGSYASIGTPRGNSDLLGEEIANIMSKAWNSFSPEKLIKKQEPALYSFDKLILDKAGSHRIFEEACFNTAANFKPTLNTRTTKDLPSTISTTLMGNRMWLDVTEVMVIGKK